MRLISFDVGIKNMAYCIFDISNNTPTILDWGILNLCENPQSTFTPVSNRSNKKRIVQRQIYVEEKQNTVKYKMKLLFIVVKLMQKHILNGACQKKSIHQPF